MKHYFSLITLLITISSLSQQQKGIVYYGYIEALGIGNAKGPESNAYILFNKDQSYYVTAKDSLEKAEKLNEGKTYENEGESKAIYLGMKASSQGDQVVYNIKKNTMWSNFLCRKQVYVKEITPKINWKIEKETKKIGSFYCKKATSFFRGRNYTAWFIPEITVPFGPWKLNGLPGLIVEAYDTNKEVYWFLKSIEYPTKSKENIKYISVPKGNSFITYDGYKLFQIDQKNISADKLKMMQKKFPDVVFGNPKLSNMFVEFE